jgi:GNAT superfamily N-acetyltransferase
LILIFLRDHAEYPAPVRVSVTLKDNVTFGLTVGNDHVKPRYSITAARPRDLARLPAIELAAARLLAGHAPESVLTETTPLDALQRAQRSGHLWVALADDVAVGFAHVELIEPDAVHLEEIDVHPEHGRRGLGTELVLRACRRAATEGYASVTLSTFRGVPWNMPFYARLGFEVASPEQLSPALRAIVEDETRRGLDPAQRVVMRRALGRTAPVPSGNRVE